jgi:HB1, ASXL, restriction endonuclease HTH domain
MLRLTRAHRALAESKEQNVTTKEAIEHVLAGRRKPMRVPAIIEAGVPLATTLKGKTPGQVFYSVLYSESKKADGLVVQTGRGEFKLNPKRRRSTKAQA